MKSKGLVITVILWAIAGALIFIYNGNRQLDGKIQQVFVREKKENQKEHLEKMTIYRLNNEPLSLVTEEVEINTNQSEADEIREILTKTFGEESKIKILGMYMNGSDLYLDLNKEFLEMSKTPEEELYLIYSIVNSVTSVKTIKRVKIIIEGQEIDKGKYSVLSKFYERNINL